MGAHAPDEGDRPPDAERPEETVRPEDADRVATLRGAGVGAVNGRRLATIVVGLCLVVVAVLAVVFFVAGLHKNDQTTRLHQHGVPVTITVTSCVGQLGGSGSNAAGYTCQGTYLLDGHRYTEPVPGTTLHPPGSMLAGVALPGDPALVTTTTVLATEHPSNGVFILPAVLLAVLVVGTVGLVAWRRRAGGSR
ncbi:MAG TPA: hypothetical protein VHX40_06080 [Acidimicrobiales bacterium]|nr:hypothetical protein [Acidimicrobiales bacterium]